MKELTNKQVGLVYFWNRKFSYYVLDNMKDLKKEVEKERKPTWIDQDIFRWIHKTEKERFLDKFKHRIPKYCARRLTIIDITYDKRRK